MTQTKKWTRHEDTNILKLHELKEKCVNFYKTPKRNMTEKKHDMTQEKHEYDIDTRITESIHNNRERYIQYSTI